jgi:BASS family bile acid:Na+ symporter
MSGNEKWLTRTQGLVQRWSLGLLLAAYALAAVCPSLGSMVRQTTVARVTVFHDNLSLSLPMLLLAFLLFSAGLHVRFAELGEMVRRPLPLLAGTAANVLVPVALVVLLIGALQWWHNSAESEGLVLGLVVVAAMPVAGSSTAWSQHANGSLALSLGLVVLSTLLSPFTTPLTFAAVGLVATGNCADVLGQLSGQGTGTFLLVCVVFPSLAGMAVRALLSRQRYAQLEPGLKLAASLVLLLLCYANASVAMPEVVSRPDWDFFALVLVVVAVLCLAAFAAGWGLGRLLQVGQAQRRSLMFGLGMNNNGTGMVLACASLAGLPEATLPVLVYNLVQHLVAGAVHRYLGQRDAGAAMTPIVR